MATLKLEVSYKTIPGYSNYQINREGDIRRLWKHRTPTTVKPRIRNRLVVIRLMPDEGKRKYEPVHKLMQRTFMRPSRANEVVYHKNRDRTDNRLDNLAYIDKRELGRRTGGQSRKAVIKYTPEYEVVTIYRSAREAARQNHMSYQTIIDRCNGLRKSKTAPDGFIYDWEDDLK